MHIYYYKRQQVQALHWHGISRSVGQKIVFYTMNAKMEKRSIIVVLLVSVLLMPLCTVNKEVQKEATVTTAAVDTAVTTTSENEPATTTADMPLSELQIEACNNADLGGTCETKLQELNVVPLEDCCGYLGKCCI